MDPLFKVEQVRINKTLPARIIKKIDSRVKYVYEGVERVENASGVNYPPYYIEPALPVASSGVEVGQLGALYARTLPIQRPNGLQILIQLAAPLVVYGLKGTIHAVLAHEFMHYAEFVRRFTRLEVTSDETSTSLFESTYADYERLYEPKHLFKDRGLVRLVKTKFLDGLRDEKLHEKTAADWIDKGLPAVRVPPESNIINVSLSSILGANFDPILKLKLEELDRKIRK